MRQAVKKLACIAFAALAGGCASVQDKGGDAAVRAATFAPLSFDRAYVPTPLAAGNCANPGCWIRVDVSRSGDSCTPMPDQSIVRVTNPGVVMAWQINTPGYSWPTARNGIEWTTPGHPFVNGRRTAPQVWQWQARGRPGEGEKYHAYKVYVVEDKTGRLCVLDPGVVTDW
jgi:hypothetical protein